MNNILTEQVFYDKRSYFDSGATLGYEFRVEQLKKLKQAIRTYEKDIIEALHNDMQKPEFEAYTSEIGFVYAEINDTIKHLKRWMSAVRVKTPWYFILHHQNIFMCHWVWF